MKILIVTVFAIVFFNTDYAQSEWRQIPGTDRKVSMNITDLEHKKPRIRLSVHDSNGSAAEWVCWNRFRSDDANACISYQSTGRFFTYMTARDIDRWAKQFKKIPYAQKGKLFEIDSHIGNIQVMRGKTEDEFEKECITFNKMMNGSSEFVRGWYCARAHYKLDDITVKKIISSINLDSAPLTQWRSGLESRSKVQNENVSNSSIRANKSNVEQLKTAKDLFEQKLITEMEYDSLRKKILGLN